MEECTVCHEASEKKDGLCSKRQCKVFLEESTDGNYVCTTIRDDSAVCYLLLKITILAAESPRRAQVFVPFPHKFIDGPISGPTDYSMRNFGKLSECLHQLQRNWEEILNLVKIAPDDALVRDTLGLEQYVALKFILMSRRCELTLHYKEEDLRIYKIVNTPAREEQFTALLSKYGNNSMAPQYLFHGSKKENWFSIIRNGVRNCSKSSLQLNGASGGPGVYLGGTYATSQSYSYDPEKNGKNFTMVAIAQVAKDRTVYYKHGDEYVVPNDEEVILRYLIIGIREAKHVQAVVNKVIFS